MNDDDIVIASDDDILSVIDSDIDLNEVSVVGKKKKSTTKKKKTIKTFSKPKSILKTRQPQPMMQQPPRPPQPQFNDTTFEDFSNPQKRMPMRPEPEEEFEPDDDEEPLSENDNFDNESIPEDNNVANFDDYESRDPEPSEGFETIEDEKQDLLYKFHRLQSKGHKVNKKYNMHSDIIEMRAEFNRIRKDIEANASVKFSRRALLAIVSGAEFLNKRYDPFNLELNGWSESVMENLNDGEYDNVFERLHEKYSGKVQAPPEMELMMSLAGSALMFHMTKSMFKGIPDMQEFSQKNPNFVANIMNKMKGSKETKNDEDEDDDENKMKGPSVDLGNLGSMFGNFPPPPMPGNVQPPSMNRPKRAPSIISVSSSDDSSPEPSVSHTNKVVSVAVSEGGTKRRGRKPTIRSTSENTINL